MAELEAEGGPLLVGAAQAGGLTARHPFLHTSPGDLHVVRGNNVFSRLRLFAGQCCVYNRMYFAFRLPSVRLS